jgi:hypothetical protein
LKVAGDVGTGLGRRQQGWWRPLGRRRREQEQEEHEEEEQEEEQEVEQEEEQEEKEGQEEQERLTCRSSSVSGRTFIARNSGSSGGSGSEQGQGCRSPPAGAA